MLLLFLGLGTLACKLNYVSYHVWVMMCQCADVSVCRCADGDVPLSCTQCTPLCAVEGTPEGIEAASEGLSCHDLQLKLVGKLGCLFENMSAAKTHTEQGKPGCLYHNTATHVLQLWEWKVRNAFNHVLNFT